MPTPPMQSVLLTTPLQTLHQTWIFIAVSTLVSLLLIGRLKTPCRGAMMWALGDVLTAFAAQSLFHVHNLMNVVVPCSYLVAFH